MSDLGHSSSSIHTPRVDVTRLSSPSFIGRDAELGALVHRVTEPPALCFVEGEAGVGKTRLVHELLATAEVACRRQMIGHCLPLREPLPLAPIVDAVRTGLGGRDGDLTLSPLAGSLRPILPEMSGWLPPPPPGLDDAGMERHRLYQALLELLTALSPAVLVIEDLHWVDDATAEFLLFATSQPSSDLAVVMTYRGGELSGSNAISTLMSRSSTVMDVVRCSLAPLTPDEVHALISSILGTETVTEEFATHLHQKTGGIPFAVEEVVRLLQERNDLVRAGGGWGRRTLEVLDVPTGVRAAVQERARRLSPEARRLLDAAAVLEAEAEEDVLIATAGLPNNDAREALSVLLNMNLLDEPQPARYRLRHPLTQQAVYEAAAPAQRRELHRRAMQALEALSDPPLVQLAHHALLGSSTGEWLRYTEAAADQAAAAGDDALASRLLADVLAFPRLPSTARARMAVKLGSAALESLVHADALPLLRAAIADPDVASEARGELRVLLGLLLWQQGDVDEGQREHIAALPDLGARPALLISSLKNLAMPLTPDGRLGEHLSWLEQAEDIARTQGDPEWRTVLLGDRADILLSVGDRGAWAAIEALPRQAISIQDRREVVRVNLNLAVNCIHLGHYQRARSFLVEAAHQCDELGGYQRLAGGIQTTGLMLDFATGAWDGLFERSVALRAQTSGVPHDVADIDLVSGLLSLARGDVDRARQVLTDVADVAARVGSIPTSAAAAGALGEIDLCHREERKDPHRAREALQMVRRKEIWVWGTAVVPVVVELALASGDDAEAALLEKEFSGGLEDRDAPAGLASLALTRALLAEAVGDAIKAADMFAEAEHRWHELPNPYQAARAKERHGRCLVRLGDPRGAAHLLEALETFAALGADWDWAKVMQTSRHHGIAVPNAPRRARRRYGAQLSPREREVAELASNGLTNAGIAERLFLSPRTVAHHLERAMRKVGVSSRVQLARRLEQGDGP